MFKFLDATEAKQFGVSLANAYKERVPAGPAGQKKAARGKEQEAVGQILRQAETYKREHKLNFYKKSQLGNAFKWAMIDAGYEREFVDGLTLQILFKLR